MNGAEKCACLQPHACTYSKGTDTLLGGLRDYWIRWQTSNE